MATKATIPLVAIRDNEHAAELLAELIRKDDEVKTLDAQLSTALTTVSEKFDSQTGRGATALRVAQLRKSLEVYANAHRKDMDGKTLKLVTGSLQFREGNPACQPLSKAWTWKKILGAVVDACLRILDTCGIRLGNPEAVDTIAGIIHCAKPSNPAVPDKHFPALALRAGLIRLKIEFDKEVALKAHRTGALTDADLATLGLKIEPEESFLIRRLDGSLIE